MTPSYPGTDFRVASGRQGLCVLLRNKCAHAGAPPVLFIHGATYPSTVMFDYAIDGYSWLDWMAHAGFDAWCIDLLGYGGADRPAEMSQPAERNGPIVDTAEAVGDVKRAMDFILARRGVPRLDLVGYSWGTAIAAQVAAEEPHQVGRLALGGALWLQSGNTQIAGSGALGAYRTVTARSTIRRWTVGLNDIQIAAVAPPQRFTHWADAAIASDPQSTRSEPPLLRAPSGVVYDVTERWLKGVPTYDPAMIQCPVAIVVGEWDRETTPAQGQALFALLTGAARRRLTIVGAATHSLLLENQRHQLYETVRGFLAE